MAFHVRDKATDALVRELAVERGVGIGEAIKLAVEAELTRIRQAKTERLRRVRAITDEIDAWPRTGLKADKAFFDQISGD